MPTTPPSRSDEQRKDALKRANNVRQHRARIKMDLKVGRRRWPDLLDDPLLDTMKVWDLLIAVPKFGRVKVNKILTQCKVSPSKTVGGLTDRQRDELVKLAGTYRAGERAITGTPRRRDRVAEDARQQRLRLDGMTPGLTPAPPARRTVDALAPFARLRP